PGFLDRRLRWVETEPPQFLELGRGVILSALYQPQRNEEVPLQSRVGRPGWVQQKHALPSGPARPPDQGDGRAVAARDGGLRAPALVEGEPVKPAVMRGKDDPCCRPRAPAWRAPRIDVEVDTIEEFPVWIGKACQTRAHERAVTRPAGPLAHDLRPAG